MSRLLDLTGSKFNRLTVVERDYEKEKELKGKISYYAKLSKLKIKF